jgi:chromate reductase
MAENESGPAQLRLLAIAGSMRAESVNRKLVAAAVYIARQAGADVDHAELRALALPLYDGDLEAEQGLPQPVVQFKERIAAVDGLLIASPEYNHSIPGVLKNAIDWASRGPDRVFSGKAAALLGAAPGAYGASRGLPHLRQVMAAVGVWVVPALVTLPNAGGAFDESGALTNEAAHGQLEAAVGQLLAHISAIKAAAAD